MDEIPTFTCINHPVVLDYLEKDVQANRLTVKGVRSEGRDKLDAFIRLISHLGNAPMLVFLNHREPADWVTLYIGSGKKDKVNKVDIVGLFLQKGKLKKDELGLIDVLDYSAFVAIRSNKVKKVLELLKDEKIKGKKLKIELSKKEH